MTGAGGALVVVVDGDSVQGSRLRGILSIPQRLRGDVNIAVWQELSLMNSAYIILLLIVL